MQQKFCVSLNRDVEKIYYDQRFIIDGKITTEPRTWKVSKVNRISPSGVSRFTLAQDQYNNITDYIEKDDNGNVIGLWADYYTNAGEIIAEDYSPVHSNIYSSISFSGMLPELKVGGSYKTFTVNYFDGDSQIDFIPGNWSFVIDGEDVSNLLTPSPTIMPDNQIKIKFSGDGTYIGKILTIGFDSNDGIHSELKVEIKSL